MKGWYDEEKKLKWYEYCMIEGKYIGRYRRWYYNGHLYIDCFYIDGKLDGICREWYENGQIKTEDFYKNDKYHGNHKWWYDNGQLGLYCFYKDGQKDNVYIEWQKIGIIILNNNYKNGERHGLNIKYDEYGQFLLGRIYKDGKFIMNLKEYEEKINIKLDIVGKIMLSRYDCFDSDKNLYNYFQYLCPELFGIISDYALYKKRFKITFSKKLRIKLN